MKNSLLDVNIPYIANFKTVVKKIPILIFIFYYKYV